MTNVQDLLQIDAEEVKDGGGWDLVVDYLQDVELQGLDVLNGELLVRNLLVDHLHFERVDVLILGRNEHASDSNDVQVADLPNLNLVLKVSVHQANRQEEGLVIALEVGKHLYVPVYHARSQGRSNLVANQAVVRAELLLKLFGVVQY